MIRKYVYGNPIDTQAVVADIPAETEVPAPGNAAVKDGVFSMEFIMGPDDIVYGLGESQRGINKRGWEYISDNLDDPNQTECRRNLYGSHNFLILDGEKPLGLFVDTPEKVRFDVGYTRQDTLRIEGPADLKLYVIEGESPEAIAREFRKAIGKSYVAPFFAFGYGQSRWGYKTKEDFTNVIDSFDKHEIPIDLLYMDIDYMDHYKDFTVSEEFGDLEGFKDYVDGMKKRDIHLVPIIDAGVKKEAGYKTYEEGVANNYFCKLEDQKTDFVGAVWPGYSMMPDFLNSEAAAWFGNSYKALTDAGIDAFWNDMNEPALFFSEASIAELKPWLQWFVDTPMEEVPMFELDRHVAVLKNNPEDYRRFWHNMDGRWVRHDKVHNLYGYKMSEAAGKAFERLRPDNRTLMFSRSSYIGMHRSSGIWTGDNHSWWSHLSLLLHQLPGLNMAGFLYTGCDLGGFGADTTRDLLARYLQLGIFTPLMRNHATFGTREQEPYQFENPEELAHLIRTRYRLIPYLYSEYMKAIRDDALMFRPLAFVYPNEPFARQVEDQLMLGDEIMIVPVTVQNARGRYVWLPEEMKKVAFRKDGTIAEEILPAGHHWVEYPLDEVVFFIRPGKAIPLTAPALRTGDLDLENLEMIGYPGASYALYEDDGTTPGITGQDRVLVMAD